jgi:hypothetical protein
LVPPGGIAISAATIRATAAQRARRPSTATAASDAAKIRNVRWVPTSGMRSSAARNVPTSEPAVEIAYSRPAVVPE